MSPRRSRAGPPDPGSPATPRLPPSLEVVEALTIGSGDSWAGMDIRADAVGAAADDLDIAGCRITGSRWTGVALAGSRISDTVWEQCDLAAAELSRVVLTRVVFVDCRLTGADLSEGQWHDVRFDQCRLDEGNLRMVAGERVRFDRCTMRSVDLYASRLPGAGFFDSDLTGSELSRAELIGARFAGSRLESLRGVESLRGGVIDSTQVVPVALQLLNVFSVTVDDDRGPDPA